MHIYSKIVKRTVDFIVSLLGILIISPFFVLIIFLLFISNKGKVFFVQERPGKNGKIFRIIKFKTMSDSKDGDGNFLPDEDRLSGIGKFIRKTSLDELPQLINVIKGEMSLIGPRPLLVEYLSLYSEEQNRRHEVRPGITGWAQVNGRNAIGWNEKLKLDILYVDQLSFALDLKIIYLTTLKVFKAEGISSETSVTMEKFKGNF